MRQYPKIGHYDESLVDRECYAFEKLDGSSMRFEWGRKRGFYKYGSRGVMIDKNTPLFGGCIDLFLNKYGQDLDDIFRKEYRRIDSFVVFGEFFGENSFAGQHIDEDEKNIVLFDVNQFRKGFLSPNEFIQNFGHLDIPKVIYKGLYTIDLVNNVKSNRFGLSEGVVCKGVTKTKKDGEIIWMSKIKCTSWLQKLREKYGENAIIEEFNNNKDLIQNYI